MPPSSSLTLTTLHPSSTSNANKDSYSAVPPGHSGRLKYAEPQNLPSFPSVGLRKDHAAASAAASLGWANQKSIEPWKPDDTTASASAAAALANQDCKMPPAWEPERSKAGSKAAALAAGAAQKHHIRQSSSPSAWGNSAANIAFKASKTSSAKVGPPDLARIGSMKAAKGAMAGTRPRSTSSPQVSKHSYPDQANAAANALSAATIAHRPTVRAATNAEGGATPYVHMNRQMFTSLPPVKPEVEEQKRAEVLHASALAMAKRMYNQQQKMIDTTKLAHARSSSFSRHGENASDARHTSAEELTRPMSFNNLQEAAYRLAQERLAKLHVEHQATRDVQEYYGALPASPQKTKFGTVRSKLTRRRAASDGELMDDQARSHQIRKEMSMFNSRLNEVDEQKRARDREALLATAQRNVKARLQGMDQKLFEDTGRIAPGKMSEWESKAQTAARTRVDSQRIANADKVDLGGGKFMDREEVNQIAAKRIQPLLDEINEKAEAERERQLALRLEEEKRREEDQKKKQREKEVQEIHKKLKGQQKDEDKLRKQEIKEEERTRKEGEKAARAEQKRLIKEEKAASKPSGKQPAEYQLGQGSFSATTKNAGISFPKLNLRPRDRDNGVTTPPFERSPISDSDTTSPTSKMRSWFKNRFSRPRAKSSNAAIEDSGSKRGFIGGVALTKMRDHNASMSSIDNRSASMREVAMAGRRPVSTAAILSDSVSKELRECGEREMNNTRARESSIVSSLSSRSTGLDKFMEARSEMSATISPPRLLQDPASGRGSPARESRFSENLE